MKQRSELKKIPLPEHDTALFIRVRYLIWVESLITIGCHFGPNDLPADVWDQLLVLNIERSFVDRLVQQQGEKNRKEEGELNKARAVTGAPAPGGTLFSHSKPFR